MKYLAVFSLAGFAVCLANAAPLPQTQSPATPRIQVAGTVTTVDANGNQVSLKTDKGDVLTLTTSDKTQILHAQPGEADPKKWGKLSVSEIQPGDEALAYYRGAPGEKSLMATTLVIRNKSDLNQLAQKQLDDWKKRGTSGTVTAVDANAKTFTIRAGGRTFTVEPSEKTQFHEYSPDSAKVSDAKPSSFAAVKAGDQAHVLGNKSENGATISAESVYFGTFRQIAATINSIDAATGEIKATDLATKKPLTIQVNSDATLKKLPEPMAQTLARRYQGGRNGSDGDAAAAAAGPARGGPGGGDIQQMLARLPAIPLAELKPKDAIMVSTTMGSNPAKVTAVMLLAGVEPILTAAPNATRDIMGGWNLGGGEGEGN